MVETQFADDDASVNRRSAPRGQRAGVQNAPEDITTIGRGIVIEGDVEGSEDLVIDGKVDGTTCIRMTPNSRRSTVVKRMGLSSSLSRRGGGPALRWL